MYTHTNAQREEKNHGMNETPSKVPLSYGVRADSSSVPLLHDTSDTEISRGETS